MKRAKREKLLWRKLGYTAMILTVYLLGRRIPLYGIDGDLYLQTMQDVSTFLGMTIGGDVRKISVFALGISPYMIASILVMMVTTIRRAVSRSRYSIRRTNRTLWLLALLIALFQACSGVRNLTFSVEPWLLPLARGMAALQMTAGAMLILWLSQRNREFGIGGQTVLILVNLTEGLLTMVKGMELRELLIPGAFALGAMVLTLILENTEFRIPVQRISIYSIYSEKSYQAFKCNPIGVMPAMFSTAIFSLVQLLLTALQYVLRGKVSMDAWLEALRLDHLVGIWVYIGIIYVLTVTFSMIFLGPGEMAEQMKKSNDSICNIPLGTPTRRYLRRVVLLLSLLSATAMSLCLGIPLLLQFILEIPPALLMLPSICMMLTGVSIQVGRELETIVSYDAYRVFL